MNRLTVLGLLAGAGALVGTVALFAGRTAPGPTAGSPSPEPTAAVAAPVSPPGPRAALETAVRELDLIRTAQPRAAQDFTLPLLGGQRFRLAEQRGRVVLVNFWATWCPPCREEMPSMERLWRRHRDRGFVLLAISLDADPKVVPPFVKQYGLTFPVALDPGLDVANAYGVRALPASFIVDRGGLVAALALGPRNWDNQAAHLVVEGLLR
jgi:peroxiredoxin